MEEITYEIWQDDVCVVIADNELDAHHYMSLYLQDGPASLYKVVSHRSLIGNFEKL